jgi:hypothetical protein
MQVCWLCGDLPQRPGSASCTKILPYSRESVACSVAKFGLRDGEAAGNCDGDVVCGTCMDLLVKIDQSSYELDVHVTKLKSRIDAGGF